MTINFEAQNIKGIEHIAFPIEGITLVAGMNGAGKSSLKRSLCMVLNRDIPAPKDVPTIVRTGASKAQAVITGDDFEYSVSLPNRKAQEKGAPPVISPVAADLVNLPELKKPELSAFLQKMIAAEPTVEDLEIFLGKQILSEAERKQTDTKAAAAHVWQKIKDQGWDRSLKFFEERGQQLKGQWHQVAGETYGSDKAKPEKFLPAGWDSSLDKTSREELEKGLASEREILESLIRHSAATDATREKEVADLQALADQVPDLKTRWFEANETAKDREKTFKHCANKLQALGAAPVKPAEKPEVKTIECSGCGMHGLIKADKLIKHDAQAVKDEIEAAQADYLKAITEYYEKQKPLLEENDNAARGLKEAHEVAADWKSKLTAAEAAAAKIETLAQESTESETLASLADIEKQRAAVEALEKKLKAYVMKREADALHVQIERNQYVIDALKPDGVRGQKLAGKLEIFNDQLEKFCTIAGYPKIRIDRDMDISYGSALYKDISEGEQYRVTKIFQLMVANEEDAACVISDRTEVLDSAGKSGFFMLCKHLKMDCVAMMKVDSKAQLDRVPDLGKAGLGKTLWLENSVAVPLSKAVQ